MVHSVSTSNPDYFLGHSTEELNRLINQADFFGELTAHLLQRAGLARGMHVLDAGCGAGDVSFLAARFVGPEGQVTGVDKSPVAVALATQRAESAGLTNVSFITSDLAELTLPEPVDALIGRLVLMYFSDPAVMLRNLLKSVKPGGIVAFQEFDIEGATSEPRAELFELTVDRIRHTFARAGAGIRTGLQLGTIFRDAGLPAPRMTLSSHIEYEADSAVFATVAGVARTVLPLMQRTGVATAAEVDIDTLADRLRDEALALNAALVTPPLCGAWTRTPS